MTQTITLSLNEVKGSHGKIENVPESRAGGDTIEIDENWRTTGAVLRLTSLAR
jgi:hypothetical protein